MLINILIGLSLLTASAKDVSTDPLLKALTSRPSCDQLLVLSPENTIYLREDSDEAMGMEFAGQTDLVRVVDYYSKNVPWGGNVLEVGPWFNPIGNKLAKSIGGTYVAWDLDLGALESVLRNCVSESVRCRAVQMDLNSFRRKDYHAAMVQSLAGSSQKKISAMILSSVLNYVDYKEFLKATLPNLDHGGYLFVVNSSAGTPEDFHDLGLKGNGGPVFRQFMSEEFPGFTEVRYFDFIPKDIFSNTSSMELGGKIIPTTYIWGKFISVYKRK